MPLYDSFSAGSTVKLARMSSIPTTEDLKYALAESKKLSKPVEMPFENKRVLFVIKVLFQGAAAPRWTFQRGDGASAKIIWTRDTHEVMMIQNKIKVESAYDSHDESLSSGTQIPAVGTASAQEGESESTPIVFTKVGPRPFTNLPNEPKFLKPPKPLPLAGFPTSEFSNFQKWPQPEAKSEQQASAAPSLSQVRSFARKTMQEIVQPAIEKAHAPTVETPKPPTPPDTESEQKSKAPSKPNTKSIRSEPGIERPRLPEGTDTTGGAAPTATSVGTPSVEIPLPPAINFDTAVVDKVLQKLSDSRSGLMTFEAMVFFLFREFGRYLKNETPLAMVICEVAVMTRNGLMPLPAAAIPTVAYRINSVCSPLSIATQVNESEFAILMPDLESEDALTSFVDSLYKAVAADAPLLPDLEPRSTVAAIGAASIPQTCNHPGVLVAAAEMAKEMAKGMSPSYLLFPGQSK